MSLYEKTDSLSAQNLLLISVIAIGGLTLFNSYLIMGIDTSADTQEEVNTQEGVNIDYREVVPEGEPDKYGETLEVSYDDVSQTNPGSTEEAIEQMAEIDRDLSHEDLSEEELDRYIDITSQISCEYCCDVPAIIFEDGEPACACEHSYAMRGLAKYLITEHESDFSDEEILEELGKWKVRFFPDQHVQKAQVMEEQGLETDFVSLTSNEYRGVEQQGSEEQGGMVGSC